MPAPRHSARAPAPAPARPDGATDSAAPRDRTAEGPAPARDAGLGNAGEILATAREDGELVRQLMAMPGPAEQALQHAAKRFAELELGIDAALAHLDLAALYVGDGAGDAVRHLGSGLEPGVSSAAKAAPFAVPSAQRAQMEALLLVLQACAVERLTPERLAGIAALVERELRPSPLWWSGVRTLPFTGDGGGDAGVTLH